MGIKTWLWNLMRPKDGWRDITADYCNELGLSIYYRQLAFWACVQIIANAVSKVRWRTFIDGKEVEGLDYYRLNIRPNLNQNSSEFYRKLIAKLFAENEVLVISDPTPNGYNKNYLMVADTFTKTERAVADTLFTDVTVNDFTFKDEFKQSDVFYMKLNNDNVKRLLDLASADYAELLALSQRSFKTLRGRKGILHVKTLRGGSIAEQQAEIDMYNNNLRRMFEAENGFTVLEEGKSFTDLSSSSQKAETTRDIQAIIDDMYKLYARAFGIPDVILKGDIAGLSDAVDYLVKFGVEPVVDMMRTEFTSKLYDYKHFLGGSQVRADVSRIQQMSLKDLGSSAMNLISSGLYSVNEMREKADEPKINEDWADRHWMTLNYETAERAEETGGTDSEE